MRVIFHLFSMLESVLGLRWFVAEFCRGQAFVCSTKSFDGHQDLFEMKLVKLV